MFPCLFRVDCENFVDAPLISSEVEIEREIENFVVRLFAFVDHPRVEKSLFEFK
jgi:hypothetical protein